jgi:hypothetical protein
MASSKTIIAIFGQLFVLDVAMLLVHLATFQTEVEL